MSGLHSHFRHDLEQYEGTYSYISPSGNVESAVIFVHGFFGDETKTWLDFQSLIDETASHAAWSGSDLFFFKYSSVWAHIVANSFLLEKLIADLYPTPNPDLFRVKLTSGWAKKLAGGQDEVSLLPAARAYKRIKLVGHSEGAVVIRQALLSRIQGMTHAAGQTTGAVTVEGGASKAAPVIDGTLSLFAPALFGYRPSGWLGALARSPVIGDLVDWVFSSTSAAYQDLKDPGGLLAKIETQTKPLVAEHPILKADILWGAKEHVVKQGQYEADKIVDVIAGGTHTSICKPTRGFLTPLEFVQR